MQLKFNNLSITQLVVVSVASTVVAWTCVQQNAQLPEAGSQGQLLSLGDSRNETALTPTHPKSQRRVPQQRKMHVEMLSPAEWNANTISLCQYSVGCEPCRNCPIQGVDCIDQECGQELSWAQRRPVPWQAFSHGEYVGPARGSHVPTYRVRVDDSLTFVFRLTREETPQPYQLNVGDEIQIELSGDEDIRRTLMIQPDGTINLPYAGQIKASGRTVAELTDALADAFRPLYPEPELTVTPIKVNTVLDDIRNTVDNRQGQGGQAFETRVSPDGSVQLPAIGTVFAQGLTLEELRYEIEERYRAITPGLEITPILTQRAPRYIYVLGEVVLPNRYELTGPTTAMQAIALAQGWSQGSNLRQIVVFRRTDDWRLIATRLDLRGALYGKRPVPSDEIWLRDSDIVLVPKTPLQRTDELIDMVFTRGVNPMLPLATGVRLLEPTFF